MGCWKTAIGDVLVTIEAPDGVDVRGARVEVRPADREAFLRAADAVGGIGALSLPEHELSYAQAALAFLQEGEGGRNFDWAVAILEPPREQSRPPAVAHPFFGPLAERVEREAGEAS